MTTADFTMFDALFEACRRAGYTVELREGQRGWVLRVHDPVGAEVCHTLVGDRDNLEMAATNISLYLKPFLSLERQD